MNEEEQIVNDFRQHFNDNKDKYLVSNYRQIKIHHKKRINKKWLKRYGVEEYKKVTPECFEEISKVIDKIFEIRMPAFFDDFADVRNLKI
jgi:hypothetical protein